MIGSWLEFKSTNRIRRIPGICYYGSLRSADWIGTGLKLKDDHSEVVKHADAAVQGCGLEVARSGGSVQAGKVGRQQLFSPVWLMTKGTMPDSSHPLPNIPSIHSSFLPKRKIRWTPSRELGIGRTEEVYSTETKKLHHFFWTKRQRETD